MDQMEDNVLSLHCTVLHFHRGDSLITSRPGGRWVCTFFVILRDGQLGVWVVLD